MNRTLVPLSLLFFLLFSCSPNDDSRNILFYDGYSFPLNDSEVLTELDSQTVAEYGELLKFENDQVPLYRCIQGTDYKIFIGIPMESSVKRLANGQLKTHSDSLLHSKEEEAYYSRRYLTKKSVHAFEMATITNKENLFFFLMSTNSSQLADSLHNYDYFAGRIVKK